MAITADIQQQVFDLLSRASNLSFVSAEEETTGSTRLALAPGQKVTAEVLTKFPDNRVQVQIGSERFNMQLPLTVRQGQSLELTFVSAAPRATFAIARPTGAAQPVSLSDASRLLGLLVDNEQVGDPQLRASLQSIGDILRRTAGAGVLANLMDEAITYGSTQQEVVKSPAPAGPNIASDKQEAVNFEGLGRLTAEATRLTVFESNAARILENIARNSRFILVEATNQPVVPLPLLPGEEVDASVLGTLPGGRAFVQVAGTSLELILPRTVPSGEILRLTYISSLPKPLFALPRSGPDLSASNISGAGRWLGVLEHSHGGLSDQQLYVLERLNTVLKSLPPDSPAFTAIQDEATTYHAALRQGQQSTEQQSPAAAVMGGSSPLLPGNGVILSDDMAKLLQALIKGNRLALLEAINQQAMPLGFAAGQQFKGEVLASLGGGSFLVQVADQALEFSMPKGIKKGDRINLFFITDENQPTFLMARFGRSGDSRVSDTGRWLSGFLRASAEQMPAQATMGLLKILLGGPPADAAQVGSQLQQGLRESGLFYEAHLTRWFQGEYPLDSILREPQGSFSKLKQQLVVQNLDAKAPVEETLSVVKNNPETMAALFKKAGDSQGHEGIADQRTLSVVREQLQALQSGQMTFRGELFPGQHLEWKVSERESHRNASGTQERAWNTELQLDLPKLGNIRAKLKVDGNRVSIDILTGEAGSAEVLHVSRTTLIEQLQVAGLAPVVIEVRHETP
ncbi:MAG TPA: flagellar hook-length control protein FliK [Desulfuromonadaceae bacterium]|jgi:hypothetical protein